MPLKHGWVSWTTNEDADQYITCAWATHYFRQGRASPRVRIREMQGDIGVPVRRAYGHRPTGLTWAMAWAGTVMMPLAVRTLMAPAGPLTSGPHQA